MGTPEQLELEAQRRAEMEKMAQAEYDKEKASLMVEDEEETLNGLPACNQWHEGMDPDHIFEDERRSIAELRKSGGEDVEGWTDKQLVFVLFGRRNNLEEAKALLKVNIEAQKSLGVLNKRITLRDLPVLKASPSHIFSKHLVTLSDQVVFYGRGMNHNPGEWTYEQRALTFLYFVQWYVDTFPVKTLRNGMVLLFDLSKMSLKNYDVTTHATQMFKSINGIFPFRMRTFYIVNGGFFVNVGVKMCKYIMPKKLYLRVVIPKDMTQHIDAKVLPISCGGEGNYEDKVFFQEMEEYDKAFSA